MKLISIRVDEQELDLSQDFSVRFSFNFPFPDKDSIPTMATYWFTLPATDRNNMIFRHSNNLYVSPRISSYNCSIMVAGLVFNGKLFVKTAGQREYKTFAVFNDLSETFVNKQVSEAVEDIHTLGADTDAIIAAAKTMSQNAWPTAKYAFPHILNEDFYGDANAQFLASGKYMNKYSSTYSVYIKNYIQSNLVYNINVLVPMPYLFFILENMFEKIGWTVEGKVWDDDDFKKLIYFNNYHLENISDVNFVHLANLDQVRIGLTTNKTQIKFNEVVSDENSAYTISTGVMNCKATGVYYFSFSSWLSISSNISTSRTLSVYVYNGSTYTLLSTIAVPRSPGLAEFYLEFSANLSLTSGVNYTFFLEVNEILSFAWLYDINFQFSMVSNGLNRFLGYINLKNHVPRISTSEFLSELMKKFSFAVFFDFVNKIVEFEHWNNIIDNNNYIDLSDKVILHSQDIEIVDKTFKFTTEWSADDLIEGNFKDISKFNSFTRVLTYADLPTPGIINQLILVISLNKYYVTVLNYTTNLLEWQESFDNFYDIENDSKDAIEVKSRVHTVFCRQGSVVYPVIKQKGSSPELGINDQGLKFINYHGFENDSPYASNSRYMMDGTETTGVPMQLQGVDGTYDRYGKKLYEYLQENNPVEMDLLINPADFVKISKLFQARNPERKIRIGSKNYIPETVDITVSINKIEACKVKLV